MSSIELRSPFPPEVCETRLRAATDPDGLRSWLGSRPVVGRVSGRSIRLRKRIGYNNSFQTFLTGSLEGCGGATVFRGRAGMHPLLAGFLAVWFGGVVLIGGAVFVAAVVGLAAGRGQPAGAVIPPAMLAFGIVLVGLGRWLAQGEEAYLVDFVAEVIAAPRIPDAEQAAAADGGGR